MMSTRFRSSLRLCDRCRTTYSCGVSSFSAGGRFASSYTPRRSNIPPSPARQPRNQRRALSILQQENSTGNMSSLYGDDTPDSIKNSKGLHLITQSTPNGQKVQIMLEELKEAYGTEWDTTLIVSRQKRCIPSCNCLVNDRMLMTPRTS